MHRESVDCRRNTPGILNVNLSRLLFKDRSLYFFGEWYYKYSHFTEKNNSRIIHVERELLWTIFNFEVVLNFEVKIIHVERELFVNYFNFEVAFLTLKLTKWSRVSRMMTFSF